MALATQILETVSGSMLIAFTVGGHIARPTPAAPQKIEIVGLDYAFQMPAVTTAGQSSISFVNKGKVGHELNISLLKKGASVQQFMDAAQADKPTGEYREGVVGVLFADPGKRATAQLSVDLLPGRTYVVICINRDKPDAKRHYAMGMYSAITPTASTGASEPPTRVDTITAMDYAFRYPHTVEPGHHSFAFVNTGKVRHEAVMFLLKSGVTLQQALETQKSGGNVKALIEDAIGVLHSPAGTTPLGRLDLDMVPGRSYVIVCTLSDSAKAPPHVMLGMSGEIDVRGK
jgi:plastocyanin